jgi:hypothetical protein
MNSEPIELKQKEYRLHIAACDILLAKGDAKLTALVTAKREAWVAKLSALVKQPEEEYEVVIKASQVEELAGIQLEAENSAVSMPELVDIQPEMETPITVTDEVVVVKKRRGRPPKNLTNESI